MLSYHDLSIPFRSLLILGLFLELCIGCCMIPVVFRRKNLSPKLIVSLGMASAGVVMIIHTAEARANLRTLEIPEVSAWLCSLPIFVPLLVFAAVLAGFVYLIKNELRFRKNTITRSSIKEGIDKISSGLCFYRAGGRVTLVNRRMNELCFMLLGRDLQNAELFWEILSGGDVQPGVQRLSYGSRPSFRLQDGAVWSFAHEDLNGIYQLSAADTTQIQAVTDELKAKNIALAALNLRLRKHGENVDELTRSKERLETKARIHSELGQALLSTRRYLMDEDGDQPVPLELWQRNIAMLRKEAELKEDEQPLEMLSRIAASTGIAIQFDGDLPSNADVQKLFVQAAAEALTNAVSHAQAKTLYISFTENQHTYMVCFCNDGDKPDGEVTEGGGLGSLRKKVEREGGSMTVESEPAFHLAIALPKERGDTV